MTQRITGFVNIFFTGLFVSLAFNGALPWWISALAITWALACGVLAFNLGWDEARKGIRS